MFTSSAAVYGNNCNALETDYLHPINFYGMAKKYCERIIRKSGVPYVILRLSNVYGKKGKGIVSRLLEDNKPTITSPLHYTRDFVHCSDVCNAIILALNSKVVNETINISTGRETMLHSLQQLTNTKPNVMIRKKKEIKFSCLDNSKAIKLLKWKPKVDLVTGIKNYDKL
ncbi:MAG: NAD-dependent epimerase/dehydratase family protein [Nanoarchaeota archaeon]